MDPAIHNSNTLEFGGRRLRLSLNGSGASDQALEAVRRFVAERGTLPTAASWTHACMSPSEKTIRRRFGSFKAAVQCAGIDTVQVHLTAPLGCRVLVDENGNVGSACPENKAARR